MKQKIVLFAALIFLFVALGSAQEPTPSPSPSPQDEEPIRISTEEVHLNVLARSSVGDDRRFVSTLKKEDLLVVEEGTPQEITSFQRVPASVLLMLDTGRELNFVKNSKVTQLLAKVFVYNLPANNSLSIIQYYDKVETVSDWGTDYQLAIEALDKKLFTGRRSRFTDALNAGVNSFKSRPLENRHLVLITDGVETVADDVARQKALQNLLEANITVHIISYTQLEEQRAQASTQRIRLGNGKTKPRIDPWIYENILRGLPISEDVRVTLRQMNEAQELVIANLDKEMTKRVREKQEIWKGNEKSLQAIAEDSGGIFQAPEDPSTMFKLAVEMAKAVDSQYVITYIPKKSLGSFSETKNRKVRVSTHCEGIEIQSRQKIVVNR